MDGSRFKEGESDPLFDRIAQRAATLCGTVFASVNLVQESDVRRVGRFGAPLPGRDDFCAIAILQAETMFVEDARRDPRFAGFPSVLGPPYVRFYAGAPILDGTRPPLGTVCVLGIDPQPFSTRRAFALQRLARIAGVVLEVRRCVGEILPPESRPETIMIALRKIDRALMPLVQETSDVSTLDA